MGNYWIRANPNRNNATGFANGMITPETPVPFGIIMRWYDQFLGKVRAGGIGFLEREA